MFIKEQLQKPLPFPYFAWVIQSGKPKQIFIMSHKLLPENKVQLIVQSTVLYSRTVDVNELFFSELDCKFAIAKQVAINRTKQFLNLEDDHVQAATF
jgi:hypothetical protein